MFSSIVLCVCRWQVWWVVQRPFPPSSSYCASSPTREPVARKTVPVSARVVQNMYPSLRCGSLAGYSWIGCILLQGFAKWLSQASFDSQHTRLLWTLNPLLAITTCAISELSGCSCGSNSIWYSIWDIERIRATSSVTQYKVIAPYRVQSKVKVQRWVASQMTVTTPILQNPVCGATWIV